MLFCDREAIIKEDAPGDEWRLHIYGPSNEDPTHRPPDDPPFYASFMKKSNETITAFPFGHSADPSLITVMWNETGKNICQIFIGDDCYVMFTYGTWRFHNRGFFRLAPQPPFSAQDYAIMEEKGFLEEV